MRSRCGQTDMNVPYSHRSCGNAETWIAVGTNIPDALAYRFNQVSSHHASYGWKQLRVHIERAVLSILSTVGGHLLPICRIRRDEIQFLVHLQALGVLHQFDHADSSTSPSRQLLLHISAHCSQITTLSLRFTSDRSSSDICLTSTRTSS
ncbi:uncharacterized protein K489DRAFT_218504 [Dissoconium aciculare CBS 342.82]|uniref:Uncharacterized protein n=1 Tax=Dissoconium aciculare CBS 342.82 TaxID=1314786 RepID=A0A6J3M4A6_9PEZI|nr:uncharacterized protein K489DRAFT_218504 [Dissoconium aciculare CBS 342.82]KAF1822855.1 hypothetical protein K489DRAFT_218504 [Dissoconium aciculare CBS 342.82]